MANKNGTVKLNVDGYDSLELHAFTLTETITTPDPDPIPDPDPTPSVYTLGIISTVDAMRVAIRNSDGGTVDIFRTDATPGIEATRSLPVGVYTFDFSRINYPSILAYNVNVSQNMTLTVDLATQTVSNGNDTATTPDPEENPTPDPEPIPDQEDPAALPTSFPKLLVAGAANCMYDGSRGLMEHVERVYIDHRGARANTPIYGMIYDGSSQKTLTNPGILAGQTVIRLANNWRWPLQDRDKGDGLHAVYLRRAAKVTVAYNVDQQYTPSWLANATFKGALVEVDGTPWNCWEFDSPAPAPGEEVRVAFGDHYAEYQAHGDAGISRDLPIVFVAEADGSAPVTPDAPVGYVKPEPAEPRPSWLAGLTQYINPHTGVLEAVDHGVIEQVYGTHVTHSHNSKDVLMPCLGQPHPLGGTWRTSWDIAPHSKHVQAKNFIFREAIVRLKDPNKSSYQRNGGVYEPNGIHPNELERTGEYAWICYTIWFGTAHLEMFSERWKRVNVTVCTDDGEILYSTQYWSDFGRVRTYLRDSELAQIPNNTGRSLTAGHYILQIDGVNPDNTRLDTIAPSVHVPYGRIGLNQFATNGAHRLNPSGVGSYNTAMSWTAGQVHGNVNDINVNMPDPLRRPKMTGSMELLPARTWRGNDVIVYKLDGSTLEELAEVQNGHTGTQFWFTHWTRDLDKPGATFSVQYVKEAMLELGFVATLGDAEAYLFNSGGVFYTDKYALRFHTAQEYANRAEPDAIIKQYINPNLELSLNKWNAKKPIDQCNPDTDWERYTAPDALHNGVYVGRLVGEDYTGVKNANNVIKDTDIN